MYANVYVLRCINMPYSCLRSNNCSADISSKTDEAHHLCVTNIISDHSGNKRRRFLLQFKWGKRYCNPPTNNFVLRILYYTSLYTIALMIDWQIVNLVKMYTKCNLDAGTKD